MVNLQDESNKIDLKLNLTTITVDDTRVYISNLRNILETHKHGINQYTIRLSISISLVSGQQYSLNKAILNLDG